MRLLQAGSQRAKVECFLNTVETFLTRQPFITAAKQGTKTLCWAFNWLPLCLPPLDYLALFTGKTDGLKTSGKRGKTSVNEGIGSTLSQLKASFGVTAWIQGVHATPWVTATGWDRSRQKRWVNAGTLHQTRWFPSHVRLHLSSLFPLAQALKNHAWFCPNHLHDLRVRVFFSWDILKSTN